MPWVKPALLVANIKLHGNARIWMKLLVFPGPLTLRRFWKGMGSPIGDALGAVTGCAQQVTDFKRGVEGKTRLEVDPLYFAVMGLSAKHLSGEIIAHEATHAAIAYLHRARHKGIFGAYQSDNEDEDLCYTVGRIAAAVTNCLYDAGLYGGNTMPCGGKKGKKRGRGK
jgi:hypothetical protein